MVKRISSVFINCEARSVVLLYLVCAHACMHACMYVHTYMYTYMYMYMCVYIYIYIYIYIFTGTWPMYELYITLIQVMIF